MDEMRGVTLYVGSETRITRVAHAKSGEQVVLKLPRDEAASPQTLEKLRHEYAMLRALEVPGVIRAIGLETHGRLLSLVLESWGDISLHRALQEGPLPVATSLHLSAALARTLGQVHRRGIIHRDIKPQNILVNAERNDVRLIDFGVAIRWTTQAEETTTPEALVGTLAYMAPEQTGRMNRSVDSRADLYALGATLYQMLTGVLPFEISDALELIHAHMAKTPPSPHIRAPERRIPEAVSAIVLKLMANSPEDRYQTADGAAYDLERAARACEETGTLAPFELAARDWEDRLRKPLHLVGRERETAVLEEAFAKASNGAVALALVAGPSGVGKSALVQALRARVRERGGIFAPGKFDQLRRSTPYSAVAQALRSVVRRRLADPTSALEPWKQAWRQAAGPNGRILVDLMPELVHILGEPKPLVEVGSQEAKNRFHITVQSFLRTIATAKHPLVLFVDDLQWADPASLVLLQELLTNLEGGHFLAVGAYRDDEIGASHPLHALSDAATGRGVNVHTITLRPLEEAALSAMVAETLDRPVADVVELSRLVKEKTDGSPFFVGRFLQVLHEQKLLRRDPSTGAWQWQREAIERAGITDNVVTLLMHRLRTLSPGLQSVLHLAACIGNRFPLELVTHLAGQSAESISAMLDEAVREGLLVHEDHAGDDAYEFVHDRVQQAAYDAHTPEERLKEHLSIGRRLHAFYGASSADNELFETLYHRNRAASLVTDPEEKGDLAAQNLRAGQHAKTSTAYAEAVEFLKIGQALLGEAGWVDAAVLTFETHLCMAEAATLAGQRDEGERLFRLCLERARDAVERAQVVSVWLPLLTIAGQVTEGTELGLEALAGLGLPLPRTAEEHKVLLDQVLDEIEASVGRMTLADWKTLPVSTDRRHELVCSILMNLGISSSFGHPSLSPCCHLMIVPQTLRGGLAKSSLSGFGAASIFLAYVACKLSVARSLHEAVQASLDRYDAVRAIPLYASAIASLYWTPLAELKEIYRRAARGCAEEGNITMEDLSYFCSGTADALAGAYLPEVARASSTRSYQDATTREWTRFLTLSYDALLQVSAAPAGDGAVERKLDAIVRIPWSSAMGSFYAGAFAGWAGLHLGVDRWSALTSIATEPLWPGSWGNPPLLLFTLTLCVAAVHCLASASAEERVVWEEKLAFHSARLALWAESCPENARHMLLLVNAGRARLIDKHEEAARLYGEAVEDARRNGFVNDEALGLRLTGEHCLAQGNLSAARAFLREAHETYARWGALGAADRMRERYPDFFPAVSAGAALPLGTSEKLASGMTFTITTTTTTSKGPLDTQLDTASALRAAQAISGDRILGSLIGRMLRLLAENAGAERAVLALSREGALHVQAQLTMSPERLELDLNEPIDGSMRLPGTLVQYVARGQEPVVLGRASDDIRFEEDPYLRARRPASVLAVPLVHQGRLSGVMYLEHPRVAHAFPGARVELVTLLASQAATAVENAILYSELAASNERLEQQVQERTAELKAAKEAADTANKAKSDFLSSMSHELRTPLNSIMGYSQILERLPGLQEKGRDSVRIIHKSGEHLLTLINDILDLAKIEAGRMELVLKDIHFPSLVRMVIDLCQVRAEQKGLKIAHEHIGPELMGVRADERQIAQVLLNLLSNAIKFTAQGSVVLRVEVLDKSYGESTVRFQVKDSGSGIAPEHLSKVFEPFEQIGDQKARAEGTGLGLAITKKIVEQMGGRIDIESRLGQGSVFTVTLRLAEAAASPAAARSWEDITGYQGERRTILVVDDNLDNRAVVREMLTPIGLDVIEAESGELALRLAVARRADLVIMDLGMPGMDGFEAIRLLRQKSELAKTVIIASSASVSEAQRQKSMSAGSDDFLAKPVRFGALLEKLERYLGLTWTRRKEYDSTFLPASSGDIDTSALTPPPDRELALLLDLAVKGRMRNLLDELQRIAAEAPHLRAWIDHVRDLTRTYQIDPLREFLRKQAGRGGC